MLDKRPRSGGTLAGTSPQRYVHFPVRIGRNPAGGFQPAEGVLPSAYNQQFSEGKYTPKFLYWPIKVTEAFLKLAKDKSAAFITGARDIFELTTTDVYDTLERVCLGDGSGTLADIAASGGVSGTTVTLKTRTDARKFSVGMSVNGWSARTYNATQRVFATSTYLGTINAVNISAGTLTINALAAGVTLTNSDVLTHANDQNSSGSNNYQAA